MYAGGLLGGGFAAIDPTTEQARELHTLSRSEGVVSRKRWVKVIFPSRTAGIRPVSTLIPSHVFGS